MMQRLKSLCKKFQSFNCLDLRFVANNALQVTSILSRFVNAKYAQT